MSLVEKIEQEIQEARNDLEYATKVFQLISSEAFQEIVVMGYITEGTEQLLQDRADPSKQCAVERANNDRNLDAIAYFKHWLNGHLKAGQECENRIDTLTKELSEAREMEGEV